MIPLLILLGYILVGATTGVISYFVDEDTGGNWAMGMAATWPIVVVCVLGWVVSRPFAKIGQLESRAYKREKAENVQEEQDRLAKLRMDAALREYPELAGPLDGPVPSVGSFDVGSLGYDVSTIAERELIKVRAAAAKRRIEEYRENVPVGDATIDGLADWIAKGPARPESSQLLPYGQTVDEYNALKLSCPPCQRCGERSTHLTAKGNPLCSECYRVAGIYFGQDAYPLPGQEYTGD